MAWSDLERSIFWIVMIAAGGGFLVGAFVGAFASSPWVAVAAIASFVLPFWAFHVTYSRLQRRASREEPAE